MSELSTPIWLNADLGEGCAHDAQLYQLIDIANIACGGHAGDLNSMHLALSSASDQGVRVGAHPSYVDREGFGRRNFLSDFAQLKGELTRQIETFENLALSRGIQTFHVKPHGQLYHDIAWQKDFGEMFIEILQQFKHLKLLILAGCPCVKWASEAGISVLQEAFADRRYHSDGRLVSRSVDGAVIENLDEALNQAAAITAGECFSAVDQIPIRIEADTLCVHGDSDLALNLVRSLRGVH